MKGKSLKKYLLEKPQALEDFPFGPKAAVYKIRGRMFALLTENKGVERMNLKCEPNQAFILRDIFPAVLPGYHMNKKHWNTVVLDGSIPVGELERMIDHSYALVVKKLKKAERIALEISYGPELLIEVSMWTEHLRPIDANMLKLSLHYDGRLATFEQALKAWQQPEFAVFFNRVLASVPFKAFFWEVPALQAATAARPFECVFVDSPALSRAIPDRDAFQDYFCEAHEGIVSFNNLGGDAMLVVPVPLDVGTTYPHIAAFSRSAPVSQQIGLWQQVGRLCSERLGSQPLWLNTSGLGVSWAHIRFDSYPKYYSYEPYKQLPEKFSV